MCTHLKYIYNKYLHERVLVPCGKCPACLQQKADARAFKIRSSQPTGTTCLFVTLTYNNDFLPVIRKDSIRSYADIPVYRRNGGVFDIIGTVHLKDLDDITKTDITRTKSPNGYHSKDYIGIVYYKDVQNFFKRLRINLLRHYNYHGTFKYYSSAELGETDFRPHFHIVLTIPSNSERVFRLAIDESWRMHDSYRLPRWIETAFDVSAYSASYVNCGTDLPKIFRSGALRQKHSYSKGYGISASEFTVSSILDKTRKGSLSYVSGIGGSSQQSQNTFLIPHYVIGRYFPIFKGFTRLTSRQARNALKRPIILSKILPDEITSEDLRKITVSLRNHYEIVKRQVGLYTCSDGSKLGYSYDSYINDFMDVWRCYHSSKYRMFMEQQESEGFPPEYYYDNIADVTRGIVHHYYFNQLNKDYLKTFHDQNSNPLRVAQTQSLSERYDKMKKRKKTNYHFYNNCKFTR